MPRVEGVTDCLGCWVGRIILAVILSLASQPSMFPTRKSMSIRLDDPTFISNGALARPAWRRWRASIR